MYQFGFEKLEVWQESRTLARLRYTITSRFPGDEKFGMSSQMRRFAVSVCSNIADGSSRKTNKDQASFYLIAFGSLMELLNQSIISNDLLYLEEKTLNEIRGYVEAISRMLNALRNKALAK